MRRRELFGALGAAAAWPLAARAQQPAKLPTIGFMGSATSAAWGSWTAAFVHRLSELGYIEGQTIRIEFHWAEGSTARAAEIAAEFARIKVDVIVTGATPNIVAAKQATSVIPIVFATAGDPLGAGLVASLARPGGNITGLSQQRTDVAGKRLEMLREVVPGLRRLAIMANVSLPDAVLEMGEVQGMAKMLDLDVAALEIRGTEDVAPAFASLNGRWDALYVVSDPLVFINRIRINTLAKSAQLPTVHGSRVLLEGGGLMSYGADVPAYFGVRPILSIKFFGGRSQPTSRWSSQPSSTSRSTSRLPTRSVSPYRTPYSSELTR
jgi:putative ABC transport system substrate-binding protein